VHFPVMRTVVTRMGRIPGVWPAGTSRDLPTAVPALPSRRGGSRTGGTPSLDRGQRTVFAVVGVATLVALAAPYPLTKVIVGTALAVYWAHLLLAFDERFVGMYVLLLPTLQLAPLERLGVPALNWQTAFLGVFLVAIVHARPPVEQGAIPRWLAYFTLVLVASAGYSALALGEAPWPLVAHVKNWIFPFALFFLGRRCTSERGQVWFLIACVSVVSLALALHGLRDALTTNNLLGNRPGGLLMNQPNLFGGYLAMYAFVLLFVARTRELSRLASLFLTTVGLLMVVTLVFTLSRGAWLAFAATTIVVGLVASRGVVLLLALALFFGYQWAPEEATERTEMTVQAVGASSDVGLTESLDGSAAVRVVQWQTFPKLFAANPIFGTGLHTYERQLFQLTGIRLAAHATPIQVGVEMGAVGIVGYLGLLGAIALTCLKRARASGVGSLQRSLGLGLLAATICLALLDLSGARFQEHTVTTFYFLLLGAFVGNTDRPRGDERPPAKKWPALRPSGRNGRSRGPSVSDPLPRRRNGQRLQNPA
jgi:O-antigen ligase